MVEVQGAHSLRAVYIVQFPIRFIYYNVLYEFDTLLFQKRKFVGHMYIFGATDTHVLYFW